MASPIVHVVLTNKIFNTFFQHHNKKDFFIGTCLPDIRYLKVTERDKTHFQNVNLDKLNKENSFLAGLKFHSILDKVREDYIVLNDTYNLCPESKYSTLALKLLEDRILYNNITNWNECINYLDDILDDEVNLGIKNEDIKKWHSLLQQLFSHQPNKNSIQDFASELFFSNEDINELDKIATELNKNNKVIKIIKNLYINFDSLLIEYKNKN
ncbi:hypothetical protein KKA27_02375 [Patescibacteria group bacterium]|nr:hypothetical protein [Patescibacteria group bacterium]MBU2633599.1 hypothetical protein [Patescibacteria group bacterium]